MSDLADQNSKNTDKNIDETGEIVQEQTQQAPEKVVERVVYVEKPKRKLGRKILLGTVVVVGGLWLVGSAIGGTEPSEASNNTGGNGANTEQVADREAPEVPSYGIGDPMKVEGGVYTVSEAGYTNILHDPWKIDPPKQGNFVVVKYTYKNTSDETQAFDGEMMTLTDSKGNSYEVWDDNYSYVPDGKDLWYEDINPGVTEQGWNIYEIPPDRGESYTLHVTSQNIWSTDEAKLPLGSRS